MDGARRKARSQTQFGVKFDLRGCQFDVQWPRAEHDSGSRSGPTQQKQHRRGVLQIDRVLYTVVVNNGAKLELNWPDNEIREV